MVESSMRAVVIREAGDPSVLEVRAVPVRSPESNEIEVRVAASGVNRADLLQRLGRYPAPRGAPSSIPGLEYAGTVERVGSAVSLWSPGDRVMGIVGGGGYAERLVVFEREALAVPDDMPLVDAAAIPEAWLTAWDALVRQGHLSAGETVLVHAVGSGVGTAALQLARGLGARVIGTSRTPGKLERARALGLDHGLAGGGDSWPDEVLELTAGRGADVILDLVGGPYLRGNLRALALQGRLLLVGVPAGSEATLDLRMLMGRRASITGTVLRARPLEEKMALARDAQRRMLPLVERMGGRPVIDRRYPPDEAADAHRRMEANLNFGKLLIVWES